MAAPKVFVSHSHKDDAFTERLVFDLRHAGADAWMDKTDLGAGDFQERISQALSDCEWFVLVLTKAALESKWVRQEVNVANILHHQGQIQNLIFIQAGPVQHPDIPAFWRVFNIFDATTDYIGARNRTLKALGLSPSPEHMPAAQQTLAGTLPPAQPTFTQLNELQFQQHNEYRHQEQAAQLQTPPTPPVHCPQRLADLGFTAHSDKGVAYLLPPLCMVRAGLFLMGSNPRDDKLARKNEQPQHSVTLPIYEIARFPVTVAEYACFVRAGQREPNDWLAQLVKLDHPVVNVTWHDAVSYAAWLAERAGEHWRLATEAEWEKAARGTDRRLYPWGNTFDKARCNTRESGIEATTPVGNYHSGASLYGAQDLAGNVWEWTSSGKLPYPYTLSGEREDANSPYNRVSRGGSWGNDARIARAAYRNYDRPGNFGPYLGFRVMRESSNS